MAHLSCWPSWPSGCMTGWGFQPAALKNDGEKTQNLGMVSHSPLFLAKCHPNVTRSTHQIWMEILFLLHIYANLLRHAMILSTSAPAWFKKAASHAMQYPCSGRSLAHVVKPDTFKIWEMSSVTIHLFLGFSMKPSSYCWAPWAHDYGKLQRGHLWHFRHLHVQGW